ncbi:MAG: META domain-containing protein [Bacteroidetes bacterium]|nr:META domain-containing protein [Bacteroidota bacterium]MBS1632196.1 META domain-containing protein [Bacteroidota bacterium]
MKNPLIIIVAALLISCSASKGKSLSKNIPNSTDTSFYEKEWHVKVIHSPVENNSSSFQTDTLRERTTYILFDKVNKRVGGSGGCNRFNGTFSINGNHIQFSQMLSTKMYCEEVQQTEDHFFAALSNVNRLELQNKKLLMYQDKTLLLELE